MLFCILILQCRGEFEVKKAMIILLIIIGAIIAIVIVGVIVYKFIVPITILGSKSDSEELIATSISPNGSVSLEVYRDNGNATVDYSVKVYAEMNGKRKLVYNKYHQKQVDIVWLSDYIVEIGDIKLDLSKNQTYDWRSG